MVQCPVSGYPPNNSQCAVSGYPPVCHAMSCSALCQSRAFGGNTGPGVETVDTLVAADMGWCLAPRSNQTEAASRPRDCGVCVPELRPQLSRQLHNIRPAVSRQLWQEKITGRVETTGSRRRPGPARIMAPNLTWDLVIRDGLKRVSHRLPPPTSQRPGMKRLGMVNRWSEILRVWSSFGDVGILKCFLIDFSGLKWIVWTSWQGWKAVVRWRSYQLMAAYLLRFYRKTRPKIDWKYIHSTKIDRWKTTMC